MFTRRGITVYLFLVKLHPVDFVYPSYWAVLGVLHRSLAQHLQSTDNCHSLPFLELCTQIPPSVFNKFVRCNFAESQRIQSSTSVISSPQGVKFSMLQWRKGVSEPCESIYRSSLLIKGSSWKAYPVTLLFVMKCKWLQLLFLTVQVAPSTDASCVSEVLRRTSTESCTDVGCFFLA